MSIRARSLSWSRRTRPWRRAATSRSPPTPGIRNSPSWIRSYSRNTKRPSTRILSSKWGIRGSSERWKPPLKSCRPSSMDRPAPNRRTSAGWITLCWDRGLRTSNTPVIYSKQNSRNSDFNSKTYNPHFAMSNMPGILHQMLSPNLRSHAQLTHSARSASYWRSTSIWNRLSSSSHLRITSIGTTSTAATTKKQCNCSSRTSKSRCGTALTSDFMMNL